MNIAIILASGLGKRMGAGKNKTLLNLGGRPIIFHTLKVFESSKEIDEIVLTVGREEVDIFEKIIKKNRFKKMAGVIVGGKERQDSSCNAMKFIDKKLKKNKNPILIFHNGANPFVTKDEISRTISMARRYGAVAVAHHTKDTIRRVNKRGFSEGLIERSRLWNMQTPQAIKFSLAKKAFERAEEEKYYGTDDVSLVERMGKQIKIIEASENNFKITTPLDKKLAELILKIKKIK